ncbi:MAG: hypothetical protein JO362_20985 [Streptomycetaceae bacterium]|nr:hypothetical protein [Streptomycetaceae bacterium]
MSIETLPLKTNGHRISRKNEVEVMRLDGLEPLIRGIAYSCAICDERPQLHIAEDAVQVPDPCLYPDGITTKITLSVPSGKIIVTDDLRPVYDWDGNTSASYNSVLGRAQAVKAMAAIGCAYGPAGNCGLGLYRTGADSYIIASPAYDEDDTPSLPEDTCLANICTDLWAYSVADFEHWQARGGDPGKLCRSATVVDVPPGTYRFVHHFGERGFDAHAAETVIFAHVERIA